ncbi:MAG: hypothetical protein KF894_20955 [Labilithrix sp.]|nr:hypothetical protein [Labilithrix sp.]
MSNLKSTIEGLAREFATSIISALRAASIDELSDVSGLGRRGARGARPVVADAGGRKRGRGGRLGRRSPDDIAQVVDEIVSLLEKSPEGLRAEQIREALACQAKELPRPLADALAAGRISKSGQKRATTYFAGAKGEAGAGKRRARGRRKRAG